MKERRYKKEYRIVTDIDPRTGRAKDIALYTGDYWRYSEGSPRGHVKRLAVWLGLYWVFALIYLRLGRVSSHCMYALLPFLLGLMPGAYGLMGLYSTWTAPERMTVTQREKGPGRLVGSMLGSGVLSFAAAIGCTVYLSVSHQWAAGFFEPLLCAAAGVCGWKGFTSARRDYDGMTTVE